MAASSELAFFEEHERFEALVSELGALDNALPKDAARAKALVKEGADIVSWIGPRLAARYVLLAGQCQHSTHACNGGFCRLPRACSRWPARGAARI